MANILQARCVLVTGASSGIGRALAIAIHDPETKPIVIVTGRREERLHELAALGERIKPMPFDMTSGRESLKRFSEDLTAAYPELDTIILSAGVQHYFNFKRPETVDLDLLETELNTDYLSIVTLIRYFAPHFMQLNAKGLPSFIIPVTSGLAIIPGAAVPGYCATKAALHSLSLSLHAQFQGTNVHVMEILPPLTESELHDHHGSTEGLKNIWMPLDAFVKETMEKLRRGGPRIPIGSAARRWARFEKGKLEAIIY